MNKVTRVLVALVLAFGLALPAEITAPERAWAASSFTVDAQKSDSYYEFAQSDIRTRKWTVNGHEAFCVNPGYGGKTGTMRAKTLEVSDCKSEKVYRALVGAIYYSTGGPAAAAKKGKSLMSKKDWAGSSMTADAIYANQHVLLGYYYNKCSWTETFRGNKAPFDYESPGATYKSWFDLNMKPGSGASWSTASTWGSKIIALTNDEDMMRYGGYTFKDFAKKVVLVKSTNTDGWRFQDLVTWSWEKPTLGRLSLKKRSASAAVTNGNPYYSLEGAEYGVYKSQAKANSDQGRVGTLTVGADGKSNTIKDLDKGTYYVKETKAPAGFAKDPATHKAAVKGGETTTLEVEEVPLGDLTSTRVTKSDADGDAAIPQAAGSLEGAEFTFRFYAGNYDESSLPPTSTRTWVMKTDAGGVATPLHGNARKVTGDDFYADASGRPIIPLGTVTCIETKAPEGYELGWRDPDGALHEPKLFVSRVKQDGSSVKVEPVNYSGSEQLAGSNSPVALDSIARGNIEGVKTTAGSANGRPLGAAKLAGAKIAVINRNKLAVTSPEDGETEIGPGGTACVLTSDEDGAFSTMNSSANGWSIPASWDGCALPCGTYELREVAPPEGHVLDAAWSAIVEVDAQGSTVSVSLADPVARGDLQLFKVEDKTQRPIGNVPFVITCDETGERHVAVTDADGFLSTAASHRLHTSATNSNDAALSERREASEYGEADGTFVIDETLLDDSAGIWFTGRAGSGGEDADDARGALPYGTYTLDEVRCKTNENFKLVFGKKVTVSEDGQKDEPLMIADESRPMIATTLTDAEGTHSTPAGGTAQLTDSVDCADFDSGSYLFKGALHVVGEDGTDLGVVATAEKQAKVGSPQDTVDVDFSVDASERADSATRLVATEEVFNESATLVARHADLTDEDQTVHVPAIETTLTDAADGDHQIASTGPQTVTDRVVFRGLTPSTEYAARLELHKKNADGTDGGALLDADGEAVVATQKFIPPTADGTVDVSVTFVPADGGGYGIVAFEEISHHGTVYAAHADISDESQTVYTPKITTTATDAATGTHIARLGNHLAIDDVIEYASFERGTRCTVNGVAHRRDASGTDAGALLDSSGNPVTASASFEADSPDGNVTLSFEADVELDPNEAVVIFEEAVDDETGAVIAAHADIADESQTIHVPEIATTAVVKGKGTRFASSTSAFVIADTIEFEKLQSGVEYVVHGEAHGVDADGNDAGVLTGEDGKPIESTRTFKPENDVGETVVEVEIDPRLATAKTVMFEKIGVKAGDGIAWIAEHKDIEDADQTIFVPAITTEAHDKTTGTHNGTAGSPATAIDEISLSGLSEGEHYIIKGTLIDKATGKPFLDNGCEVTAELPFAAEGENCMEAIEFDIGHAVPDGTDLVIFERVYDAKGDLVARHEDMDSQGQSVSYRDPSPLEKAGETFDKTGWRLVRYWWVLAALGTGLLLTAAIRRAASSKPAHDKRGKRGQVGKHA
mgnify:CR=1 FL=1